MTDKPHFLIKNKSQKYDSSRGGFLFIDLLTPDILSDVCERITGTTEYTYEFDDTGYNKGRMAKLVYKGKVSYISFSDHKVYGRNQSFQSVPTALMSYYEDENPNKQMFFYFLPSSGEYETEYHYFMYRIMLTTGIEFINQNAYLEQPIDPFISVDDIISTRMINKGRNKSNNSSYVTKSKNHIVQIYGKTYGASKYETALICIALSNITQNHIELYQIRERNLDEIPARIANYLRSLGNISIYKTDIRMERNEFERTDDLRSPRYIFNLLAIHGPKKCVLCGCEIPELVQGTHIWPVSAIKHEPGLTLDEKIAYATDGSNGLWMCENHHKLFDEDILKIETTGYIIHSSDMASENASFIKWSTPNMRLLPYILTDSFLMYLEMRYNHYQ